MNPGHYLNNITTTRKPVYSISASTGVSRKEFYGNSHGCPEMYFFYRGLLIFDPAEETFVRTQFF